MNCANHPETAAIAYCRTCGKPLCQVVKGRRRARYFVRSTNRPPQPANPYTAPPTASPYAAPYDAWTPDAPSPGWRSCSA